MASISVVINTLNEAKTLENTIKSVKKLAQEIVVIDMHSEDDSSKIARKLGAKVFLHKRLSYVEPARNYAISKATGDWILVLDPDEELTDELIQKLKEISENENAVDYYRIPRKNIIFGKWIKHARWWPDFNIRFFKKGSVYWSEQIHKVPVTHGEAADLPAEEKYAIKHNHYTDIYQFIDRLNRYTSVQAVLKVKDGYKFNYLDMIKKPSNEFFSRYFFSQGYKDGLHGLALSLLQAFSELVVYLKVWDEEKFKEIDISLKSVEAPIKDVIKDYYYWKSDAFVKDGGNFLYRLKRKFKLP